jgi:hypothetical protein
MQGFPTDLERGGERLVYWTPPKSVGIFKELGHLFLTQFLVTRKRKKNATYLLTMCQGNEESLKDFMLRFNKEKLEVDSPDDKTMLNALMQGIRVEGSLMVKVGRKNIWKITLPQFMKLTEELVGTLLKAQTLEEQAKQESKKASTAPKPKEEKNPQKGDKKSSPLFKSEPRKVEPPKFQQEVFTPLIASLTEVFMDIKGDPAFRWPQKMRIDPYRRDQNKFCEYHVDHGHSTEDCISLHREIENFVRNGKLVRFLAQERIREANQQGRHISEGGREGLGQVESRRRDQAPREGQYGLEEEQRNA